MIPSHEEGTRDQGAARLYRIVMSEAAHRRLEIEELLMENNTRRVNQRLKQDCIMTDRNLFKKKAIPKGVVLNTWKGVLRNEKDLPKDWITEAGVLVRMQSGWGDSEVR
jgi:hypothetical protein